MHFGVTLHSSFMLFILCLDDETYESLQKLGLNSVTLIRLSDMERRDTNLLVIKENRCISEYFYTCKPHLLLYIFDNFASTDKLTYLDSDLFFYSNPESILSLDGKSSVSITPHNFSKKCAHMREFGDFNAGWASFRRNHDGMNCLESWRDDCDNWCHKKVSKNRYADQKYLDKWPSTCSDVHIVQHKGANLGTWNIENYNVSIVNNDVYIDKDPLVFFHFHSFKRLFGSFYSTGYAKVRANKIIRDEIYQVYLEEYLISIKRLKKVGCNNSFDNAPFSVRSVASLLYRLFVSGNYAKFFF